MSENTTRMAFPYPGRDDTPWYDEFEDTMEALDASGYAAREDRSLIWMGGGTISWDLGTQTLTWTGAIEVASPISGLLIQVAAGSIVLRDGDTMYIPLTRYPTQVVTATPTAAYQIPSTDNVTSVAVRRGNVVYLRTGVSLGDGDSIDGMAPAPPAPAVTTDRTTARIIVGNSVNGDVASDCDYLDTGNGAQLALAIAAAGAGDDVYIRPGVYDFALVGGPSGAIVIPDQVHVRGAGRGHTFIRTRGQGEQGAFDVGERSELDDLTVEVTLPTGAPSPRYGVVEMTGAHAETRRVNIDFLGTWTGVEAANFDPVACFFVMSGCYRAKLIDCSCGFFGDDMMPSIYTLTSGSQALYGVMTEGSPSSVGCDIVRLKTLGGDGGVRAVKHVRVRDAEISFPVLVGVELLGFEADGSEVTGCMIEMPADAAGQYGIYLYMADECDIEGNYIEAWTGDSGAYGIALVDSDRSIIAKNRLPDGWGVGINLDSDSDGNIVSLNNMPLCYLVNSGTGNEVAHNINADLPID